MIEPTGYILTCDEPGCLMHERHDSCLELRHLGDRLGWAFNRKLNGEYAMRGGKDYCPRHCHPHRRFTPRGS